ncbi:hypothetical protein EXIGLDRAFT_835116 [Exidia glandulosa HHB12029]|uniref:Fungal-type protein kinase domain-containing protein n=1 Tax=Exidia glandulosa HHB12029 TaxID=1314781 RepID=A0A166AQP5_EXIGL|nr:hypothetical protein EXIGLDRAFT_835116 [Exidia glandulosa HHB12029]
MSRIKPFVDINYIGNVESDLRKIQSRTKANTTLWDAVTAEHAVVAALQRLQGKKDSTNERDLYNPIALLCNAISLAYATHMGLLRGNVIVFSSPHNTVTRGDFLGSQAKSDIISFPGSKAELLAAIRVLQAKPQSPYTFAQPWQLLSSAGEVKPRLRDGGLGQVKSYTVRLKQYLPDHSEVHAFHAGRKLLLYSLNPCGMWQSEAGDLDNLAAWIVHVALIYRSFLGRDKSLQPSLSQGEFIRWDYSFDGSKHVLAPFYVGAVPGRMTWAAFEVGVQSDEESEEDDAASASLYAHAYFQRPPLGLVKVAWQDVKRPHSEADLLQKAHAEGWIPGLVRHRSAFSGVQVAAHDSTPANPTLQRKQHTLQLESIGQPISMCTDYLHLLEVIYDGIETHLHLFERGILHRDISWANVLCNPRHLSAGNDKESIERPCILRILGNPQGEPRVLLTDLDHAALWNDLLKSDHPRRNEKTGTPSWISHELASPTAVPRSYPPVLTRTHAIFKRFKDNETHPYFSAAFSSHRDEDVSFLANFERVLELEVARHDFKSPHYLETVHTYPATAHLPRHDCESFYWILLYHLARAFAQAPNAKSVSIPPPPPISKDTAQDQLEAIATAMLDHRIGVENGRVPYLLGFDLQAQVLDVPLQHCAPLLQAMAAYLCIPWHLYEKGPNDTNGRGFVELNHVHHAFRRLILLEIIEIKKEQPTVPNVRFSTAGPRRLRPEVFKDREKKTPSQSARGSGMSGGKRSRTHEDGAPEDLENLKRLKTNEARALGTGKPRFPSLSEEESVVDEDAVSVAESEEDSAEDDSVDEDAEDESGTYEPPRRYKKKKDVDPFVAAGLTAAEAAEDSVCSWIKAFERDELWFTTGVPYSGDVPEDSDSESVLE